MYGNMRTSRIPDQDRQEKTQRREKQKKEYHNRVKAGLMFICIGMGAALFLLCMKLVSIDRVNGDDYEMSILGQQNYSSTTIAYRRGTITDRNGTVLAASERVYTLILDPSVIRANDKKNMKATLSALETVFGYPAADTEKVIEEKPESAYVRYAKEIPEEQKTAFETYQSEYNSDEKAKTNGKITGVWFESNYKRTYPLGTFACTALGFSGTDASRGNWGIEEYYNDILTGTDGREYGYINNDGIAEREVIPADDGYTVVSTLDYTVQMAAEKAIDDFKKEHTADNIAVLGLNPNNGEILCLATDKVFDLNDPSNLSYTYSEENIAAMSEEDIIDARAGMWRNFTVADAYEPGSTAKPFTVSAALELGLVSPSSQFNCEGGKTFGRGDDEILVKCAHTHGTIELSSTIAKSCNSAMMEIAAKIGAEKFSEYQSIFGLGKQCGVDLPGENGGILYSADDMGVVDLATNSFGQSFNVNMVQMAAGLASVVNGGHYYQPHIVKQILGSDGEIVKNIEPTLVRETISEKTSEFIRSALLETVVSGTGVTGSISGYSIGGKTGTAEKLPRSDKKYLVSFVAVAPADNPEILLYVVVDNPAFNESVEEDGETISAKLAIALEKQVMQDIIPYINLTSVDKDSISSDIFFDPSLNPANADKSGNGEEIPDITDAADDISDENTPEHGGEDGN